MVAWNGSRWVGTSLEYVKSVGESQGRKWLIGMCRDVSREPKEREEQGGARCVV